MEFLRRATSRPAIKISLLALGSLAWAFGLVEELYSSAATMKYLLMSLLMAAVALL